MAKRAFLRRTLGFLGGRNLSDADVSIIFESGEYRRVYDTTKLSDGILRATLAHGFSAKLGDAMALESGATMAEKFAAMDAVYETLAGGNWNAVRETLSPEQKFGILRERVLGAWKSLGEDRADGDFGEMVFAKGKSLGVDEVAVVTALSKHPKIILALAEMAAGDTKGLDVEDLV